MTRQQLVCRRPGIHTLMCGALALLPSHQPFERQVHDDERFISAAQCKHCILPPPGPVLPEVSQDSAANLEEPASALFPHMEGRDQIVPGACRKKMVAEAGQPPGTKPLPRRKICPNCLILVGPSGDETVQLGF